MMLCIHHIHRVQALHNRRQALTETKKDPSSQVQEDGSFTVARTAKTSGLSSLQHSQQLVHCGLSALPVKMARELYQCSLPHQLR
jgi:hypothetical protein